MVGSKRARTPHRSSESTAAALCGCRRADEGGKMLIREISLRNTLSKTKSHYGGLRILRSEPGRLFVCYLKATRHRHNPLTQKDSVVPSAWEKHYAVNIGTRTCLCLEYVGMQCEQMQVDLSYSSTLHMIYSMEFNIMHEFKISLS